MVSFLFVCFLNNSVYPFIGQNIFDLTILKVNSFTDMENKFIVTKGKERERDKLGMWD